MEQKLQLSKKCGNFQNGVRFCSQEYMPLYEKSMFLIQCQIYCLQLLAHPQSKDSLGLEVTPIRVLAFSVICFCVFLNVLAFSVICFCVFLNEGLPPESEILQVFERVLLFEPQLCLQVLSSKEPLLDALLQSILKCGVGLLFSKPHQRARVISFLRTELFNDKEKQETEWPAISIREDTSYPNCDKRSTSLKQSLFEM